MAFRKAIENPENGVSCEYWNLKQFMADAAEEVLIVTMAGFVTEAARWGGKQPVTTMRLELQPQQILAKFIGDGVTITHLYGEIKQQIELFADAEDVLESLD